MNVETTRNETILHLRVFEGACYENQFRKFRFDFVNVFRDITGNLTISSYSLN